MADAPPFDPTKPFKEVGGAPPFDPSKPYKAVTPDQRGPVEKLFGIGGERYQTWPEKLVRGVVGGVTGAVETGAEMTGEALRGEATQESLMEDVGRGRVLGPASLGVTGAPMAAARAGGTIARSIRGPQIAKALEENLPKEKFKEAAKAGYQAIRNARVYLKPEAVAELDNTIDAQLFDHGMTADNAPGTLSIVKNVHKGSGDVAEIMATYERLNNITPDRGTDYTAAGFAQDAIGRFLETVPGHQVVSGDAQFTAATWKQARGDWWAFKKLEMIEKAETVGLNRAKVSGTGANVVNTTRQRFREIIDSDKKSRGLPQAVKDEMERLVEGTVATNLARYVGKTFAPLGPVTTMGTVAVDLATNPKIAAAAAAVGVASHYLAKYLTAKQVRDIENVMRAATPQGQSFVRDVEARGTPAAAAALQAGTPALIPGAASSLAQPEP